jgi:hypothetical protein
MQDMIKITNLTKKQVAFLRIIWNFENEEQFASWTNSLLKKDREMAYSLLYLMQMEMEEIDNLANYEKDAKSVISSIMAK